MSWIDLIRRVGPDLFYPGVGAILLIIGVAVCPPLAAIVGMMMVFFFVALLLYASEEAKKKS